MESVKIQRFGVYWCNLSPTFGAQMQKTRPCVVISPDDLNANLDTVIIAPITRTLRKFPFYVQTNVTGKLSAIAFDQIRAIDKKRVGQHIASLPSQDRSASSVVLSGIFGDN